MKKTRMILLTTLLILSFFSLPLCAAPTQSSTEVKFRNTGLAITGNTDDCTIAVGADLNLLVSVTGLLPFSFQWEVSTDNGASWTLLVSAISNTYSIINAQANPDAQGNDVPYQYRVTISDGGGYLVSKIIQILVSDEYSYRSISLRNGDTEISAYLHESTRLIITPINENTPVLLELEQQLSAEHVPLLAYDVSLINQNNQVVPYFGVIRVDFSVGEQYNGQTLKAYHLHNNSIITYSNTVENGVLTIYVNALSPFLIEVPSTTTRSIRIQSSAHGTTAPSGAVNVADGSDKTITFLADAGYMLESVVVNGTPVSIAGNSLTLTNVHQDYTVIASYAVVTPSAVLHTVNVSSGAHGSVTPSTRSEIPHGSPQVFYFYPEQGYELDIVTVNGNEVHVLNNSYTISAITENITLRASFRPADSQLPDIYHALSPSSDTNGYIYPSTDTDVEYGGDMYFHFVPEDGYEVDEVLVDGTPVLTDGISYHFINVVTEHDIHVTYRPRPVITYVNLTTAVTGGGGRITPQGVTPVVSGGNLTISFLPEAGYTLAEVTLDGVVVTVINNTYTVQNITADHTLLATFSRILEPRTEVAPTVYTIDASSGAHGTIHPSGSVSVVQGSSMRFHFLPEDGYEVDRFLLDGIAVDIANNSYELQNINKHHTVSVSFQKTEEQPVSIYYTVIASAQEHGRISPSGTLLVSSGSSQIFYFIADDGYEVDTILVNGTVTEIVGNRYSAEEIKEDLSIDVTFKEKQVATVETTCYCLWQQLFANCFLCNLFGFCIAPWCTVLPLLLLVGVGYLVIRLRRHR